MIYAGFPHFFRKADALADLLRRQGIRAEVLKEMTGAGARFRPPRSRVTRALLKSSPHLWIGFWNGFPLDYLPANYVFLNAEPLGLETWRNDTRWHQAMAQARQVWGYSKLNAPYVQSLGVPFHYVPFGYAPYYEAAFRSNVRENINQDIDVLFFGALTERRTRVLETLRRRGVRVRTVDPMSPKTGAALDGLLARSKIVLGIHAHEQAELQITDYARVDHPLSNRLFVLHERPAPVVPDPDFEEHVATCDYGEIPEWCDYFLARPAERDRMAAIGHEWFRSEYALDRFIPYDDLHELLDRPRSNR